MRSLVAGGHGFIGQHLAARLRAEGHWVRVADIRPPHFGPVDCDEARILDLRKPEDCRAAVAGVDYVWMLAANMGGIGFITGNRALCAHDNSLISLNMLEAARMARVQRYLYTSSACIYPQGLQDQPGVAGLREEDAMPADPEPGYGVEKWYAEQVCRYYAEDHDMPVRIVRFHNVYGEKTEYDGGREKAPAAICRKVAVAGNGTAVHVWGDGRQTRSFMHVDDCVEGLVRIMRADYDQPLNLGTEEAVTIDQLVQLVIEASGKFLHVEHVEGPQGVRGRNSDNSRLRQVLGWEPTMPLKQGIARLYPWVLEQLRSAP